METIDGRYELLRQVGGGGMGAVYEARHTGTGRRVAVKIITEEFAKNPVTITRFHREAKASGAIETQHIVQVLDTGTDPVKGSPYLVMEYLTGEDLAGLLKRLNVLPPELALKIAAQICFGLEKAHEANVIHRDIKPANIFLAKRDNGEIVVKVLDFGIAKIRIDRAQELEASGLTRTGNLLGSPFYMSPEQARGLKDVDSRTDIWSVGIVLYQMLAGRRPHDKIEGLGELLIAICSDQPRSLQDVAPWIDNKIAAVVHRALRLDRNERYQSTNEMLVAIKSLLPAGWSIDESMLVSLPEEARIAKTPRLTTTQPSPIVVRPTDPEALMTSLDATVPEASLHSLSPTPESAPTTSTAAPIFVPPALQKLSTLISPGTSIPSPQPRDSTLPEPQASSPNTAVKAVVALIASAVVAFLVLRIFMPTTLSQPETTPVASASAPAPPLQVIGVEISPADASAEVDGQPVTPQNGLVELRGTLGSVHKIRVWSGSLETTTDVVVTEMGAVPSKVELPLPDAAATTPTVKPGSR